MRTIDRAISIEDLLREYPASVKFLIEKGLPCLVCGEPSWGTLEELALSKGWRHDQIERLIDEMNRVLRQSEERVK